MSQRSNISPIGLDFGEDAVRGLQVRRAADQLNVVDMFEIQGSSDASALKRAFRKSRFIGNNVVVNLSVLETSFRTLRLAVVNDDEIETVAHWQSARQLGIDASAFQSRILNSQKVYENEQERLEAIVVAAQNDVVDAKLRLIGRLGLNPVIVDATPCAIHHALQFLYPAAFEEPVVVIAPGLSGTALSIVSDGQIQFLRILDLNDDNLFRSESSQCESPVNDPLESVIVESHSGADTDANSQEVAIGIDDLAREVNKSIHHFAVAFKSNRPNAGLFLGMHEGCHQLANSVSQLTNIPFEVVPEAVWSNVYGFKERQSTGNFMHWLSTLGLALFDESDLNQRGAA